MAFAPARLMTRAMFQVIDTTNREWWQWDHRVRLSAQVREDLRWLVQNLQSRNGRMAWKPQRVLVVEIDASHRQAELGAAGGYGGRVVVGASEEDRPEYRVRGAWDVQLEREWGISHVNVGELAAVFFVFWALKGVLRGRCVQPRVDGCTSMAYLNRSGGRVADQYYREYMQVLRALHSLCMEWDIVLSEAVWIPGKENVWADWLSRLVDPHDWRMAAWEFQRLDALLGPHTWDRMADTANRQVQQFTARWNCPEAGGVDCFTQWWVGEVNWVLPPAGLIHRVLVLLVQQRAVGTVVVPQWEAQPWWPLLLEVAVQWERVDSRAWEAGPSGQVEPWGNATWAYWAVRVQGSRVQRQLWVPQELQLEVAEEQHQAGQRTGAGQAEAGQAEAGAEGASSQQQ